ncbi:MAG: hypothetical protein KA146_11660 [Leptospiraceae bacterium]|nr:hypothetical protein [Leptospiraceae bacterium]
MHKNLLILFIHLSIFYNCFSFSTNEQPISKPPVNVNPEIAEMYRNQQSCSTLIGNCNASCLEAFPYKKYSPRNSSRRVACEEECYKTLREKQNCIFYQSTSNR